MLYEEPKSPRRLNHASPRKRNGIKKGENLLALEKFRHWAFFLRARLRRDLATEQYEKAAVGKMTAVQERYGASETSPRSKAGLTGSSEGTKEREPAYRKGKGTPVPDVVDDLVKGARGVKRPIPESITSPIPSLPLCLAPQRTMMTVPVASSSLPLADALARASNADHGRILPVSRRLITESLLR